MRIIFDTDIGTDVDDCLALALVLGSPEIRLEAVTCVYGDVELRSRIVAQQLALHGTTGVPIALGARETLMRQRAIYWEGHEGVGLLHPDGRPAGVVDEHAVDLIVRTVMAHPGEITILAIGPLTNIALALSREPRIAQAAAGFVLMGGVARGPDTLRLPVAEHNIVCDPEAAPRSAWCRSMSPRASASAMQMSPACAPGRAPITTRSPNRSSATRASSAKARPTCTIRWRRRRCCARTC